MDWDVKTVRPLGGYRLSVETVGGHSGAFDMKPYLDRGVFKELKDPGYFNRVGIVFGAVTWPNGQDIAPETLLAGLVEGTAEVVGLEQAVRLEVVGVTETHDSFETPLRRVFHQVLLGLAGVGLLSVLVALAFARSIVRPIQRLTEAADALKRGDYDAAQVRVTRSDEIGLLGRTFNVMIDVLRQRERERERVLRGPERR